MGYVSAALHDALHGGVMRSVMMRAAHTSAAAVILSFDLTFHQTQQQSHC
jgi:hypothetical protein